MLVPALLAVAGLILLAVASDHLVLGASRLATRLRISPVVVGVTVIGLGTSAPEFLVSGVAASRGDLGIAVGNIIGSNIINVTLVLGVAAVIAPIGASSNVIRREVRLSGVAVAIFALLAWIGLSVPVGIALSAGMAAALVLLLRWARHGRNAELAEDATDYTETPAVVDLPVPPARVAAWAEPVRSVIGLAGVLIGAQMLVANASTIAVRLGVSQVVIGFTLVALGTSVPELVTTIAAQRRGESELVVGNLFGSNLFNSLAGGAVVAIASNGDARASVNLALLVAMVVTAAIAWALVRRGLRLTRTEGIILLVLYAGSLPIVLSG